MMINPVFQSKEVASSRRPEVKASEGQDFSKIFSRHMKEQKDRRSQVSEFDQVNRNSTTPKKDNTKQMEAEANSVSEVKKQPKADNTSEARDTSKDITTEETAKKTPEVEGEVKEDTVVEDELAIPAELLTKEVLELLMQLKEMVVTPEEKAMVTEAITQIKDGLSLNTEALLAALDNILDKLNKQVEELATPEEKELILTKLASLMEEQKEAKVKAAEAKATTENQGAKEATVVPKAETVGVTVNVTKTEGEAKAEATKESANTILDATTQQQPLKATGRLDAKVSSEADVATEAVDTEGNEGIKFLEGQVAGLEKNDPITRFVSIMKQEIQKNEPQNLLNQIVTKVEVLVQNNKNEIKMQLSPEALGNLFIKISMEEGVMTAKVFTENYQIKELLESNLNQLKINLGEKGISVSSLEVSVGQQQESFQFRQSQLQGKPKLKKLAAVGAMTANNYLEESKVVNPYVTSSNFEGLA